MANLVTLLSLIARQGSLQGPVTDFATIREKQLTGLEDFLPVNILIRPTPGTGGFVPQSFRASGALIKNAWRSRGGHLQAWGKNLFYVRLPKAANTSCSFAVLKNNFPALPNTLTATQLNLITDSWLEREVTSELTHLTGFTVVRHPLHRLVSVYRDFFERTDTDFLYNGYLFGVLPKSISFAEFVHRISQIPDRLKDQHFRPQHCFIEAYRKRKIPIRVFKLEQPEELQRFLAGYGMQLPHLNRHSGAYDYQSYYSAHTRALALKMYTSDFSVFNYDQ